MRIFYYIKSWKDNIINVIDKVGGNKNMSRKNIIFILGFIFYIIGMIISSKTIIGTIIGIIGPCIMCLIFLLGKDKK